MNSWSNWSACLYDSGWWVWFGCCYNHLSRCSSRCSCFSLLLGCVECFLSLCWESWDPILLRKAASSSSTSVLPIVFLILLWHCKCPILPTSNACLVSYSLCPDSHLGSRTQTSSPLSFQQPVNETPSSWISLGCSFFALTRRNWQFTCWEGHLNSSLTSNCSLWVPMKRWWPGFRAECSPHILCRRRYTKVWVFFFP